MGHGSAMVSAVLALAVVGTARACTLEVQFQFAPGDFSEPARSVAPSPSHAPGPGGGQAGAVMEVPPGG